jgi:hypothetical protein
LETIEALTPAIAEMKAGEGEPAESVIAELLSITSKYKRRSGSE